MGSGERAKNHAALTGKIRGARRSPLDVHRSLWPSGHYKRSIRLWRPLNLFVMRAVACHILQAQLRSQLRLNLPFYECIERPDLVN